jgi:hypothetical protein
VAAVISEMAGTAAPSSSADWKQRKPANVAATATGAHPLARLDVPWRCQSSETALIAASASP